MNGKATKQTLAFPLLYNFAKDECVVDDSFQTVESINAPLLNNMISPVYTKDLGGEYVHDRYGNKFNVEYGKLLRNGSPLFDVTESKFKMEEVTDYLLDFDSADYDADGNIYGLRIDSSSVTVYKGSSLENLRNNYLNNTKLWTTSFAESNTAVASRIRILDDRFVVVVYIDQDNTIGLFLADGNINTGVAGTSLLGGVWKRQYAKTNASNNYNVQTVSTIKDANPVIYIGKPISGYFGVSLLAFKDDCHNSFEQAYMTKFWPIGNVSAAKDESPNTQASQVQQDIENNIWLSFKQVATSVNKRGTCLSSDTETYYEYTEEGVVGPNLNIPVSYTPQPTGNKVTIDGVEYLIYNYGCKDVTTSIEIRSRTALSNFTFLLKGKDGNTYTFTSTWTAGQTKKGAEYTTRNWTGNSLVYGYESATFTWGQQIIVPANTFGTGLRKFTYTSTQTVYRGWIVAPNIIMDNGILYAVFAKSASLYTQSSSWGQTLPVNGIIAYSGKMSRVTNANGFNYDFEVFRDSAFTITNDSQIQRSNSIGGSQSFITVTEKYNNTSASSSWTLASGNAEATASKFIEINNSNGSPLRYNPGTIRQTSFNYYNYAIGVENGNSEDSLVFTVGGYRVSARGTNFNLLYNVYSGNIIALTGISYSKSDDEIGTLLTPINQIDDSFYVAVNDKNIIYRNNLGRYYKISIEDGNEIKAILDDRFIVVNTTSYFNCWDSLLNKAYHYATDENGRLMFGSANPSYFTGANSAGSISYTRYTAAAINASVTYSINSVVGASIRKEAFTGFILPMATRTRVTVGEEMAIKCRAPLTSESQPIDIYYSGISTSDITCKYRYSVYVGPELVDRLIKKDLYNSVYSIGVSSYPLVPPSFFAEYINGQGNNDMVKEGQTASVLVYSGALPILSYSIGTTSFANFDSAIDFFVLQGQFYAFMNDKIYSVIYSSGAITNSDAIIDARGMKFLGNNPMIAFFYSPSKRAIYSFTGDANLQHIYDASKYKRIGYDADSEYRHWYDEGSQSIFCATDFGLLVFGPKNTYCYEDWKNVTNVQFSSDSITHITNDGMTYNLSYYPQEEYTAKPLDFETAFYGIGANQQTTIDRWDIVLYDYSGAKETSYITVGVRSITDITVKSEEKTYKITPDMYDKWSNSILIRYVPKLIKGQGIRLYVKTPLIVQRIVPHVMDDKTGTLTQRGM